MENKGLNRNTIDKFYTKESIVDICLNYVKANLNIKKDDLIIEPSAGNGSFILGIKKLSSRFIFYDLQPENNEIIKQDYLKLNVPLDSNIHIIGNPPFGRQSSTAIKFIKKSCSFCNTISFILPKSFKKDSLKKSFPLNFHLIFEIDLPDKSFLVNGVEHDVPCIFQIWEKKLINRILIEKLEPFNFQFVKKNENPDISFRRVGVNAGTISQDIEKSESSHYFIKFNVINENKSKAQAIALLLSFLSKIIYEFNNTVGPKSISKQELISKFNPFTKCTT